MQITGWYSLINGTYVGQCSLLLERLDDEVAVRLLSYPDYDFVSHLEVTIENKVRRSFRFAIPFEHVLHVQVKHAGAKYGYAYGSLLFDPEEGDGLMIDHQNNLEFVLRNDDAHSH